VLTEIGQLMNVFCKRGSGIPGCSQFIEEHFRLRLLQWAGRPGPVLQGALTAGTHLLLEWVSHADDKWPLPPHTLTTTVPRSPALFKPWSIHVLAGVSLLSFWRRGSDSQVMRSLPQAVDASPQLHALVRVTASAQHSVPHLIHGELWLLLDLVSATLQSLYALIAEALRCESPYKNKLADPLELQLRDSRLSKKAYPETSLLRKLCWTQCEALTVELDLEVGSGSQINIFREGGLMRADSRICGAARISVPIENIKASSSSSVRVALAHAHCPSQCFQPVIVSPTTVRGSTSHGDPVNHNCAPDQHLSVSLQRNVGVVAGTGRPGDMELHCEDDSRDGSAIESRSEPANVLREHLLPHYQPKLLSNTRHTRQFEFHPSLPEVLLTGDKNGGVNVIHAEEQGRRPPLILDSCHVLGLAWLHHHPQSAVCGLHSGQIKFLRYDPQATLQEPALQHVLNVDEFPKCSSLSVNCTDDFLLASGFAHDIALYDTGTGQVLNRVPGVHRHFINISRFAQQSPHVFATASFDHTCKLWDLRQPLIPDRPLRTLETGGLNVMCTFSSDDKYLLCSGIDNRIAQYELQSFSMFPDSFHLRPSMQRERYRRSVYFAAGRHFVTAATDESHIRVMSASGKNMGVVDFSDFKGQDQMSKPKARMGWRPLPMDDTSRAACMPQGCSRLHLMDSFKCKLLRAQGCEEPRVIREAGLLAHGEVFLDTEHTRTRGASAEDGVVHRQSVQSVRTHPIIENRVGVLLSAIQSDQQSYVVFVHLDPNYSKEG